MCSYVLFFLDHHQSHFFPQFFFPFSFSRTSRWLDPYDCIGIVWVLAAKFKEQNIFENLLPAVILS